MEILKAKQTPFVLLENVDRLLKSPAVQRGRDFGIMLRTLSDLGYNVEWRIINAADYGCAQRRRRIFIFAWKNTLKYNELVLDTDNSIYFNTLFAKSFPLDIRASSINPIKKLDINDLTDTVEITQKFSFLFENSGIMIDGIVKTRRVFPKSQIPITLGDIRDDTKDLSKYYLNDKQIEQFKFLKSGKRIERVKPNGDPYFYSEGGMGFPDALDLPGRTMLTSEASINRSTHVIEDKETGKLRFITPLEAERMQSFPDNWTNTGMPENRRYFMMGNALVTKVIQLLRVVLENIIVDE